MLYICEMIKKNVAWIIQFIISKIINTLKLFASHAKKREIALLVLGHFDCYYNGPGFPCAVHSKKTQNT